MTHGFVVPARSDPWPNFGHLALVVAAGGLLSGALLAFHYAPTLDAARDAVAHVEEHVALGRLLRAVHHWSGTFALVLAALHGWRLFRHGAYKAPRRRLWVLGCLVFLVLLGFAYTGYLLAGDERAHTGIRVMEGVVASTPVVGDGLAAIVRGGDTISSATLTRLYAIHAVVLPGALLLLLAAFVAAWRRRGPARRYDDDSADVVPARPAALRRDGVAAVVVMLLLLLCALLLPPALGPRPDLEGAGSPDARPEWFFLWVNELLHLVPGNTFVVAGLLPALLALLAIALPFYARGTPRDPRRRKPEIAAVLVLLCVLGGLTAASLARAPAREGEAAAGAPEAGDLDAQAQAVMEKYQCKRCHTIDGSEPLDDTGPPLDRAATADRPAFRELYTREFFRRKVGDPRKLWPPTETNPGTAMHYTPPRRKPTPEEVEILERWFFAPPPSR